MEAVADEFFHSKVTMEVLNQTEEDERTGKKEHVVFLVKQIDQAANRENVDIRSLCVLIRSVYEMCFFDFRLTRACVLCPQEEILERMKDRCMSLSVKKTGWDLIRAVVLSEKG